MAINRDPVAPRKVGAAKTFKASIEGAGVSFRPGAGNTGGYPLHVVRVGDANRNVVVIDGPGVWRGASEIGEVTVDATPGGGREGDEWELIVYGTELDRFEGRIAQTRMGAQRMARAGAHPLFTFDTARHAAAFAAAEALEAPNLWINPETPEQFSSEPGSAWDLGCFNYVMVSVASKFAPDDMGANTLILALDGFGERECPSWTAMGDGGAYTGMPIMASKDADGTVRTIASGARYGVLAGSKVAASTGFGAGSLDDLSCSLTHYPVCPPFGRFRLSTAFLFSDNGPINFRSLSKSGALCDLLISAVGF